MTLKTPPVRVGEVTEVHTRMMRLGLAEEESRIYWTHVDPAQTPPERIQSAFEQRWFGGRSLHRVGYLIGNLDFRFLAFPAAIEALRVWQPAALQERKLICHWHVQLSDPLYRALVSELMGMRRQHPRPTIDADTVIRWLNQRMGARWSPSSTRRVATGLLGTAHEAGLCGPGLTSRPLLLPAVSDRVLAYLLYLLRSLRYEGTLVENPYLTSLGLEADSVLRRLRGGLPGVSCRQMGDVLDFEWQFDDLADWAREAA